MDCQIIRADFHEDGIWGGFQSMDGTTFKCCSLEHAYLQNDGSWAPIIQVGTYVCERYASPHFGYDVFLITGVIGHDHIEIHKANWETQLHGCVALGEYVHDSMLMKSGRCFDAFMDLQTGINSFMLAVS